MSDAEKRLRALLDEAKANQPVPGWPTQWLAIGSDVVEAVLADLDAARAIVLRLVQWYDTGSGGDVRDIVADGRRVVAGLAPPAAPEGKEKDHA
jgi:hypothetical protein